MNTLTIPTIELRKFHHAEFASEETYCFDAEVWIDGKPAFHARNEGHGGCDHYTQIGGDRDAFEAGMSRLKEYAASLPPQMYHGMSLQPDVESLISDAVENKLRDRDRAKFLRRMTKEVLFIREGKLYQMKAPPRFLPLTPEKARTFPARPGDEVLNLLPTDQAWEKIKGAIYL